MSIVISKKKVEELMNQGVSKEEIKKQLYPELNTSQWSKALKLMGLSTKRVPKIDFVIEDTETVTPNGPTYNPESQDSNEEQVTL